MKGEEKNLEKEAQVFDNNFIKGFRKGVRWTEININLKEEGENVFYDKLNKYVNGLKEGEGK